ncbi:LysR family transcriptional regulator [Pigmentiphaga aceris]|uniref:LysR family transcriptional regulator n=1 Tax=Pigmentiphaga aceris TaxID=1940612 RepID=A0A5C0ARF8_9BURK|nr:LysR substrate-binding domain-containing protein [Pigmentiphaga aceris]QEI04515.1 LysR family transcriptional regulator [Pigmentiphaga aceris]
MSRAPSTTSLLCLEASARLGSFTAAADELHMSQGAVSRQIQTLEQRLDVPLFTRRRESLVLTDAGRYYLDEVTPLLQRLARATANVMAFKWRGGDLSLSLGASVGAYWLIPRLPAFTQAHGEITLSLSTRVGPADFKAAIDASLEFGDGRRSDVHSDFVLALDLAPYAAPGWIAVHGKRVTNDTPRASLLHHHTLVDGWDHWFRFDGLAGNPGRDGPRFEIMSMALNAAVAGLGVALLPDYMVADHVAAGRLKRLSRRQFRYPQKGYYLVYPSASAGRPALQTFRHWLLQMAAVAQQAVEPGN